MFLEETRKAQGGDLLTRYLGYFCNSTKLSDNNFPNCVRIMWLLKLTQFSRITSKSIRSLVTKIDKNRRICPVDTWYCLHLKSFVMFYDFFSLELLIIGVSERIGKVFLRFVKNKRKNFITNYTKTREVWQWKILMSFL